MRSAARTWRWPKPDAAAVRRLVAHLRCPVPIARLLVARNAPTPDAARALLEPCTWRPGAAHPLPDLDRAAELIATAIRARRRITIFGDFDADGVTATALLTRRLRELGAAASPFLPHRIGEGYGLSPAAVRRCLRRQSPQLIITVDCGTTAREAIRELRSAGVDVVITDHHLPEGRLPAAAAVVNPHLTAGSRPVAGVGLALEVACAVGERLGRPLEPSAAGAMLQLAAIGTIADCVPLTDVNRTLVRAGIEAMSAAPLPGVSALMETAEVTAVRGAWEIAFVLAPRINAAGRIGAADVALELLLASAPSRAARLAAELEEANRRRQRLEREVLEEAVRQIEETPSSDREFGVVAAGRGWHPGVVGIVAARLVAMYRRPAVVIAIGQRGTARGSARGIAGVDIAGVLRDCAAHLQRVGGHAMAAGLEIDPRRVPAFALAFNEAVRRHLQGRPPEPLLQVDATLRLDEVSAELLDWIERLGPYGHGFPSPVWGIRRARITDWKIAKDRHVMMELSQGSHRCRAVAFHRAGEPQPAGAVDVAVELKRRERDGRAEADLQVVDWRGYGPAP
ncbi:MAG: single-stranded-DNA-specific exonuclease RecJ [Kiritimatiellae bacterium]|nr:single-stranded-DNA-specific exonuclease RecJ [Kiritimatiellia bacterium]